jgi:hypothetical protein
MYAPTPQSAPEPTDAQLIDVAIGWAQLFHHDPPRTAAVHHRCDATWFVLLAWRAPHLPLLCRITRTADGYLVPGYAAELSNARLSPAPLSSAPVQRYNA